MEEWELFQDSSNYGNLIIVTVPIDSPPNLSNWQYQLSLVDSSEDKKRFEEDLSDFLVKCLKHQS